MFAALSMAKMAAGIIDIKNAKFDQDQQRVVAKWLERRTPALKVPDRSSTLDQGVGTCEVKILRR